MYIAALPDIDSDDDEPQSLATTSSAHLQEPKAPPQTDDKERRRKRESETDDYKRPSSTMKVPKRRWTDTENHLFFDSFGKDLSSKLIPSGKRLAEFATKINNSRTVAQIRARVHNIINGKQTF